MITHITHLTLFVHDQEEALKFYTEKLNFKVHTDADFGELRWLTITLEDQEDLELVLMLAETSQDKALVGKQAGSHPLFSMQTDDCQKDYERLSAAGIKFVEEPETQEWGSGCSFEDLYGNVIYLCEPKD